jgi:hypothetical protein
MVQAGVEKLGNLKVLYMSNNKIKDWVEIDRLAALGKLEDLLLVGNPLYNDFRDNNATSDYRIEVGVCGQGGEQESSGMVHGGYACHVAHPTARAAGLRWLRSGTAWQHQLAGCHCYAVVACAACPVQTRRHPMLSGSS